MQWGKPLPADHVPPAIDKAYLKKALGELTRSADHLNQLGTCLRTVLPNWTDFHERAKDVVGSDAAWNVLAANVVTWG